MKRAFKIFLFGFSGIAFIAFLCYDRELDPSLINDIGNKITIDTAALNSRYNDTILVTFLTSQECGNDPNVYYYQDSWKEKIKQQLSASGYKTILFNNGDIGNPDNITTVLIRCYLLSNDVFSTEVNVHCSYIHSGENIQEEDLVIRL
ncbi:MAG: hypothetical protein JWO09_3883 [Bacteroidetes bacterium]|nr:hypothetical protein [Bacteroidota bacterium]